MNEKTLESVVEEGVCYVADTTDVEEAYKILYWHTFVEAQEEDPLVTPVGLAEALKIRVISKGPPKHYFCLKPIQKLMWRTLKSHPTFELIGKKIDSDIINSVAKGELYDDEEFVNGDYVASTDNLYSWVSETILDELRLIWTLDGGFFPDELYVMMKNSLTRHIFVKVVKTDTGEKLEVRMKQKMGQLMGSIISFPFLCLANAALCRFSMEIDQGCELYLEQCRLRVNGDDCILVGNKHPLWGLFAIWEQVTHMGGLNTSAGKTYHSKFAVINSRRFDYDPSSRSWIEQKFVNLGILFGMCRSAAGEQTKKWIGDIGTLHRDLYKQCPSELWEEVNKAFYYYNKNTLRSFRGSYCAPEFLGGLGMVGKLSDQDLRVCTTIRSQLAHTKPCPWPAAKDWQMHQIVQKTIGSIPEVSFRNFETTIEPKLENLTSYERQQFPFVQRDICLKLEDEYSWVYNLLTIQTLFKNELSELKTSVKPDKNDKTKEISKQQSNLSSRI